MSEYEERLDRAWAARTYGELDQLTVDLPPSAPLDVPLGASAPVAVPGGSGATASPAVRDHQSMRAAWLGWLSTGLVVTTIWLLTSLGSGDLQYFWPMWVIGPWGVALLARAITGEDHHPGRGRDRQRDRHGRHP